MQYNQKINLIAELNSVLKKSGSSEFLGYSDVRVVNGILTDITSGSKLSRALTDLIWPSQPGPQIVHHFTSYDAAQSIISNQKWRFYWLRKRFSEGEISDISKTHGFSGYTAPSKMSPGKPVYYDLQMREIFYSSFVTNTLTQDQESYMWRTFAHSGGVKLTISLAARHPDCRKVLYSNSGSMPLLDIQKIANKYGLIYTMDHISTLSAFYLSEDYEIESEIRTVYRDWNGNGPQVQCDEQKQKFIEVSMGGDDLVGYTLNIVSVETAGHDLCLNDASIKQSKRKIH